MKRKSVSILLVVVAVSSLTIGCGKKEADTTPIETAGTTEIIETESTEATEAFMAENTETIEATETEAQESTETEEQSPYSYTDKAATMYAQRAVNVRDLPDTSGNKVGGLSTNQEVSVTGQCNETGWYRISYNGSEAFVSDKYLGDSKVEKQTTQSSNTQSMDSQQASSDSGNSDTGSTASEDLPSNPYPLKTLEDNGSSVSYYYLTEPGHDGIDIEMEQQASMYFLEHPEKTESTEAHQYSTFVGLYKEGAVWYVQRPYQ